MFTSLSEAALWWRSPPPCQRQLSDEDLHLLVRGSSLMKISMLSALSVWGKSTRFAGSRASASTAISSRSRCFARGSPSLKACGDRVSIWLRHVRRIHPFLSRSRRIMKPSRPFLKHASAFLLNGPTRLHLLLLGRWKVPPQCAPLVMKKLMRSYSR